MQEPWPKEVGPTGNQVDILSDRDLHTVHF